MSDVDSSENILWLDDISQEYVALIFPREFFGLHLDDGPRSLYLHIAYRCNVNGECFESVENMAMYAGMSTRTAHRHLKVLLDWRLLLKEDRPGQPAIYRRTKPGQWRIPPGGKDGSRGGSAKMTDQGGSAKMAHPQESRPERPFSGGSAKMAHKGVISFLGSSKKEVGSGGKVLATSTQPLFLGDPEDEGFDEPAPRRKPWASVEPKELLAVYNLERGKLPAASTLPPARQRALVRFAAECRRQGLNPVEVLRQATRLKAKDPFYLGQNDARKKYGLDNILSADKAFRFYEEAQALGEEQRPAFAVGQVLIENAGTPSAMRVVVTGVQGLPRNRVMVRDEGGGERYAFVDRLTPEAGKR